MSNNILVTGASGFTGTWLAQKLLFQGANVITILIDVDSESWFVQSGIVDHVTCVSGTILDHDLIVRTIVDHGIDSVFHLAAVSVEGRSHENPKASFEVNIRGTYNLLESCRVNADIVKRVVVASSDKVYGDSPHLPYTEDLPVQGRYPYDVSKSCADLLARSYFCSYGTPVCVARFANIFGGGDHNWSRLVPNTIRRLIRSERPLIRSPNRNVYKRDFLYVKDQVHAYLALFEGMSRPEIHGQSYNFGMGSCISVSEVVAKIQEIMNLEDIQPIFEESDHGEILHQHLSSEKATKELGWLPNFTLEKGLTETVDWYTRRLSGSI